MNHSIVDISSLTMLEACYNHSFQFFFISFHENAMIKTTKQYKFNICFPQSNEQVDVMTMNILQHLLLFNSTEALAGLSLVAVIIHFIDFGTKIVVCLNELELSIQDVPKRFSKFKKIRRRSQVRLGMVRFGPDPDRFCHTGLVFCRIGLALFPATRAIDTPSSFATRLPHGFSVPPPLPRSG